MKIQVRVENRTFDVEVGDLHTRPILATVEGETFEVWPEEALAPAPAARPAPLPAPRRSRRSSGEAAAPAARAGKAVYAPIPGVIESTAVQPGDAVVAGQELCVLEAMKMKNIIRAPRAGAIAAVHVSRGQHVKHNDLLFEYAD